MISGIGSNSNSNNQLTSAASNFVSQNTFLTLLITQLKNQDPMSPQDSSEFVAQLAQFSSLEQITQLNKNITAVLESSVTNLIGRTVEVLDSSSQTGLTQGVVTGITYYKDGPAIKVNGQDYPMKAVQSVS